MPGNSVTISESLAIRLMALLPEDAVATLMAAMAAQNSEDMDELAMLASHLRIARRLRERAATDPDRARGIYEKYVVQRTDGATENGRKHEHCHHFVLDVDHDPLAVPCLSLYADICGTSYPQLARDLRKLIGNLP
jgi:hypothetical protein